MVLTLNANTTTFEIKKVAEQQVISNLLKLQGIADISLHGVTPHQWEIRFDPELLKNYSLTPSEISAVVNQLGDKSFLGIQKDGAGVSLPVLTQTKNIAPEKWGNLPIANKNGRIIKLADVATVKLREKPPTSYYRINGKNTINMVVYAAPGENQVKLGNKIREQLETIQKQSSLWLPGSGGIRQHPFHQGGIEQNWDANTFFAANFAAVCFGGQPLVPYFGCAVYFADCKPAHCLRFLLPF